MWEIKIVPTFASNLPTSSFCQKNHLITRRYTHKKIILVKLRPSAEGLNQPYKIIIIDTI